MKYTYRSGIQKFKVKLINLSTALIIGLTGLSGAAPLLVSATAHADAPVDGVVINEFSSFSSTDWVELYNTTNTSVSLNGWKLEDSSPTNAKIADLSGSLAAHGFSKVDVGDRLNKDGDVITLVHDIHHQTSVAYGTATNPVVVAPDDGQSAARVPDGSNWQVTYTPTPGVTNSPSLTLTNLLPKSGENYADYANDYGFTVDALNVNDAVANNAVTLTVTPDKSGLQSATYSAPGRKGGPGQETFGEAPSINTIMQDTGMQLGDTFTVTASAKDTYGKTATTNSTHVQLGSVPAAAAGAVVNTRTSETFDSIQAALADSDTHDGDTIALSADITTSSFVKITRPIVIDGNGHTITAANTVTSSVFDVWYTSGVTISDLTVDGNNVYVRGINAVGATVDLNDVTLKNSGKDGLVVNASKVTVDNITTSGNAWDGIDVDKAGAVLTVNGTSHHTEAGNAIYVDDTTTGAKVVDSNSQYTSAHINKHGDQPNDLAYNLKPADTTAPATPTLLSPVNRGYEKTNDFYFTWSDSSDSGTPVSYEFQSDNNGSFTSPWDSIANGNSEQKSLTSPEIHSVGAPDGTYYWRVRAIDAAGNTSAWSSPSKMTIDSHAPGGSITAPANDSYVSTRQSGNVLTVKGTATDDLGLNRALVQLLTSKHGAIQNKTVYLSSTSNDWQTAFNTKDLNLSDGEYAVVASFTDNAGNVYKTGYVDFTLDNTKPVAKFTSDTENPTPNGYYNDDFKVGYTMTDNLKLDNVNVSLFDTDSSHSNHWVTECAHNNSLSDTEFSGECTVKLAASVPDGTYYVAIQGQDAAGNWVVAANRTVEIQRALPAKPTGLNFKFQYDNSDITNPYLYYTSKSGGNNLELYWNAPTDWVTGYQVQVTYPNGDSYDLNNDGYQGPNNWAWIQNSFGKHGQGAYVYSIHAKNPNGWGPWSDTVTLYYGTQSPQASFTQTPPEYVNGDFWVEATASDNVALNDAFFDVRNASGWVAGCVPGTFTSTPETIKGAKDVTLKCQINTSKLVDGQTYTLRVHAGDMTGHYGGGQDVKFTVDRTAPTGTFTYSNNNGNEVTNKDVTVTLTTSESVKTPDDWTKVTDTTFTKVYGQNGKHSVDIEDLAGNKAMLEYEVKRIDKVAPVINGVVDGHLYSGVVPYTVTEQSIHELLVDGIAVTPTHVSGWDYTGPDVTGDGTHTIRVTDKAGNTASVSFTIDATAPVVAITNPNDGDALRGTVTVSGTVTDTHPDHYYFVVKDSNGKIVAGPGVVKQATVVDWSWDTTKVTDGTYTIDLEARDKAGNKDAGSTATISVTVDNTAPVVDNNLDVTMKTGEKVTLSPIVSGDTNVTYLWKVSDSKLLNNPQDTLNSATLNIGPAPKGAYTVDLTVTDQAGNSKTVTYNVTITTPAKPDLKKLTPLSVGRGSGIPASPKVLGVTTAATSGIDTSAGTASTENSKEEVKGASTDTPNTANTTSDNKSGKDAAKTSNAFLGLGWWWLLVLVVIAGLLWALLGRSANRTDKTA